MVHWYGSFFTPDMELGNDKRLLYNQFGLVIIKYIFFTIFTLVNKVGLEPKPITVKFFDAPDSFKKWLLEEQISKLNTFILTFFLVFD